MKDTTLDRIRNEISAESVANYYGFKLPTSYPRLKQLRSPLGLTEDKTPSFSITNNGKGWNCYSSGSYGDWFTFIAIKENLDLKSGFPQILEIASKITNIPLDKEGAEDSPQRAINPMAKKWNDLTKETDMDLKISARHYMKQRKGIDILMEPFKSVEMAFLSIDGQPMPALKMKDERGSTIGIQKANKRMEAGSKMGMYYERINKKETIYVVEGFSDYLSIIQMGYKNVVGLVSANMRKEIIIDFLKDSSHIVLLLDSDISLDSKKRPVGGKVGARKAHEIKMAFGIKCDCVFFSVEEDGKLDVNDILNSGGKKKLESLIHSKRHNFSLKQLEALLDAPDQISESMICDQFLSDNEVAYLDGVWWLYSKGIWNEASKEMVLARLQKFIEETVQTDHTIKKIRDTLAYIQYNCIEASEGLRSSLRSDRKSRNEIFLKNGKYLMNEDRVEEYRPEDYVISTLNVSIDDDRDAAPLNFLDFLNQIFIDDEDREDRIKFLQEWVGYCLFPHYHIQKFLYVAGSGGNGKGTFFRCIEGILGRHNYKGVDINELDGKNTRFSKYQLMGAYANVIADAPKNMDLSLSALKNFTGGDPITAEIKNQKDFMVYRNYAKFIIASNYEPLIKDPESWIKRRLQVIRFNRTFTSEEIDPNLSYRLDGERNQIFWWGIKGLKRLLKNNQFTEPKSVGMETDRAIKNSDYFGTFIEEHLMRGYDPVKIVRIQDVYYEFKEYCTHDMNMKYVMNRPSFTKALSKYSQIKVEGDIVRLSKKDEENAKELVEKDSQGFDGF